MGNINIGNSVGGGAQAKGDVVSTAQNINYEAMSHSVVMGSHRPSGIGGDASDEGSLETGVLGGLIDVRPKKLHTMQSIDSKKIGGRGGKDNVHQTVIGTEKIMIQSKPRGSELAGLESHKGKINTNRSRSKQNQMLSTQPKKEGVGSDAEVELNSSDGNIDAA